MSEGRLRGCALAASSVVAAAVLLHGHAGEAQVTVVAPPRTLSQYFILANRSLLISGPHPKGSIGVNCPGGKMSGPIGAIPPGITDLILTGPSSLVGDSMIFAPPPSTVFALFANQVTGLENVHIQNGSRRGIGLPILGDVDGDGTPSCSATVTDYGDLEAACGFLSPFPACDPLRTIALRPGDDCDPLSADVAPGNARCDLGPGRYGALAGMSDAQLFLKGVPNGANFTFCSFAMGDDTRVAMNGPVRINVDAQRGVGLFRIGFRSEFGETGNDVQVHIKGKGVVLVSSPISARICAPQSFVEVTAIPLAGSQVVGDNVTEFHFGDNVFPTCSSDAGCNPGAVACGANRCHACPDCRNVWKPCCAIAFDNFCEPRTGPCTCNGGSASCDDGDPCTGADRCDGGLCLPGPPVDCDDHNPCTNDRCDLSAGCVHTPNDGPCDDGDACTEQDMCHAGTCTGRTLDCDDDMSCTVDSCDHVLGCRHDTGGCACQDDATCTSGPCRIGRCDIRSGTCVTTFVQGTCSDGDPCNGEEMCVEGECVRGAPLDCADTDHCSVDGCTQSEGCQHETRSATDPDGVLCAVANVRDRFAGAQCTGSCLVKLRQSLAVIEATLGQVIDDRRVRSCRRHLKKSAGASRRILQRVRKLVHAGRLSDQAILTEVQSLASRAEVLRRSAFCVSGS